MKEGVEMLADYYLAQWARWVKDDTFLGLPNRCVTDKANEGGVARGSSKPPSSMPDDAALSDRAIAGLGTRKASAVRTVIWLRYERNVPIEAIAHNFHVNKYRATTMLSQAQRAFYWRRAALL